MIYSELVKKAIDVAYRAHEGTYDKSGVPYIFHPFSVAMMMDTEEEMAVAMLHDVVEDTDITLADLRDKYGFPDEIIEAVDLMTHREGVPYMDYVRKIKTNPIARRVKLGDLTHNSDPGRRVVDDEESRARLAKYKEAMEILKS